MTEPEFVAVDDELLTHSNRVLRNRAGAYATQGDRLDNFKVTARLTGLTPEKVCEVYMWKALTAMFKILQGANAIGESLNDRFADVLNYTRLAYALVRERPNRREPDTLPTAQYQARESLEELIAREKRRAQMSDFPQTPERARNRYAD